MRYNLLASMRTKLLIVLGVVAGLVALAYGLFQISTLRDWQFFGELTSRVEMSEKVVALTFDDGPTEHTQEILNILRDKDVKATFYVMGAQVERYPNDAKHMVQYGHELGNHTYAHKRMVLKTWEFIDSEISRTSDLIRQSGYEGEITFRPPHGKKLVLLPFYLRQKGMRTIMWDVEPDTYFQGDAEAMVRYTLENTKPGSIILMHPFCGEACKADREALPGIIDGLKTKGYRFVTVRELLGMK